MFKELMKNKYVDYSLKALAVMFGGFVLLNVLFMVYALVVGGVLLFFPENFAAESRWFMPVVVPSLSLLFLIGYWFAYKSKLPELFKAMLTTIPTAIILVGLGASTFRWPVVTYSVGALLVVLTLYYFYKEKKSWMYWLAVLFVAFALVLMGMMGVEI